MKRYIYEMVTFRDWEAADPVTFQVEYHFEDFFTSRKAAIDFTRHYVEWLLKNKFAVEAVKVNFTDRYNNMLVMYMVQNEKETEFYGIKRNMILN